MKAYLSFIRIRFFRILQYRTVALAGVFTQLTFGFIRVMVMLAFYEGAKADIPMDLSEAITYIWLSQALIGLVPWNGDRDIQDMIRKGDIAYELLRPLDLYGHWFARGIALRTATPFMRAMPIILISSLLPLNYTITYPPSLASLLLFVLSLGVSVFISVTITNLINVVTLFSIQGEGAARLIPTFVMIFSGMIVPLRLFPEGFVRILKFMPFSGVLDLPIETYLGHYDLQSLMVYGGVQLLWGLVLLVATRGVLLKKLRHIEVQGG